MEINYCDRAHYIRSLGRNIYGKLFLGGLILRPSCSNCKFKIPNEQSDLTIGDAWGVKKFAPSSFDSRGTSAVFIHTAKGKKFFEQANLIFNSVEFSDVAGHNASCMIAEAADFRREDFFADFAKSLDKFAAMEKYYYEDSEEIRKKVRAINRATYKKNLQEMLEHIQRQNNDEILMESSKQRERNLLVFTQDWNEALQKFLQNFVGKTVKTFGIFVAKIEDDQANKIVNLFDTVNAKKFFKIPADEKSLSSFKNDFGITDYFIVNPLNFDIGVIGSWLKTCGLPNYVITKK